MNGHIHRCFAVALLAIGACTLLGQAPPTSQPSVPSQTPSAPQPGSQPVVPGVSETVDEVSLNLAVLDKKGRKVLDLQPGDVVVTDNDVPVKLNTFQLVKGEDQDDHIVTMVFDHLEGAGSKTADKVAEKILKMLPSNRYSFAVLDFGKRLQLLQSFTSDHQAIMQAVTVATANHVVRLSSTDTLAINIAQDKNDADRTEVAAEAEKNLIAIARSGADSSGRHVDVKDRARCVTLLASLQNTQKVMQDQHTGLGLAGLTAIVRSQQQLNERKSIIYFTAGFQLDSGSKEMVKAITGAAARAGVTFYVVDMDALDVGTRHQLENAMLNGGKPYNPAPQPVLGSPVTATGPPMQQQGGGAFSTGPLGSSADFMMRDPDNPFSPKKSPMADLAKDTGGIYVDAQENVNHQLQQMKENMTTYYQATYKPPIEEYDGSFHTIVAKPVRTGLNIKTKTGYFALAPGAEAGIRPFEVPMMKLFNQSNLPQDVKFQAKVLQFGNLPDGNVSTVAVEVPIASLQVNKDTRSSLFTAHVSIVAEIKDKSGTVVEHFGENIARRGAVESLAADPSASIILQRHFLAIPGQYMLEASVYDEQGLKFGAQRAVFEIPPSEPSPGLSPLVLVKHVDTINDDNDDLLEPMRYEKGKITPNLVGVVPLGAKNVSLFFILHTDPKSSGPTTLEIEASHNGHPGRRVPLPLKLDPAAGAVPYLASFKGTALSPGDYEVKAFLTQGGKTAVQEISFNVAGSAVAASASGAEGHGGGPAGDLTVSSESNDTYGGGVLAITSETNPVPPPDPEEIAKLIEDARSRAVSYMDSLPNFMCVEVTNRSIDASGAGNWKHRDTIAELLRYRDKAETHTMLELNGQASSADRDALLKEKGSTLSGGELGGVLKAVFAPSAKAEFHWKETDALGSGTVQVFDYEVAKSNSMFSVVGSNNQQIMVGFRGQVFVDTATHSVRRISLQAEDIPKGFPTQATVMGVDYDYVSINGQDFLMPVSAELRVRQSHRQAVLNTIEFRDYKKYGSAMKILDYKAIENQKH